MKEQILNTKRREIKTRIMNREHRAKMFGAKIVASVSNKFGEQTSLLAILQEITQKFELRK